MALRIPMQKGNEKPKGKAPKAPAIKTRTQVQIRVGGWGNPKKTGKGKRGSQTDV